MKIIERIVESDGSPNQTNDLWLKASGDNVALKYFFNGEWRSITDGSSVSSDDVDRIISLTQSEYDGLPEKDSKSLYIMADTGKIALGSSMISGADGVGVQSVVQTTVSQEDGGTNVWTITLTNGQTSTLRVKNGNQGNSGYSGAAGELEVVNNLTDGGATAALSAEMGAVLEGEVSQLRSEVNTLGDSIGTGATRIITSSSFPNPGRYLANGTLSQTGWHHTDQIPIGPGEVVKTKLYQGTTPSTTTPAIIFYDSNGGVVSYVLADGGGIHTQDYTTPANTASFRVQTLGTAEEMAQCYYSLDRSFVGTNVLDKRLEIVEQNLNSVASLFDSKLFTITGFIGGTGSVKTNNGYKRTDYLDASNIISVSIYMAISAYQSLAAVAWFDANKAFISCEKMSDANPAIVTSKRPDNARYVVLSTNDANVSLVNGEAIVTSINTTVFLSPIGNDSAKGEETSALKTSFAAKSHAAKEIIFLPGDYDNFVLDFSDFERYVFRNGARLICGIKFAEAELASGYSRVYQVTCDSEPTAKFLWQHDVADADTLIPSSEYLPMYHSGRTHRLSSTRLYKASSVADIESETSKYTWFWDNGVLYFSCPSTNFATNPIVIPDVLGNQYVATKKKNISVTGMRLYYRRFNSRRISGHFDGGFVGFVDGTCFGFDSNEYLEINNFEAAGGSTDGFGGGFDENVSYQIIMKNCYGHDNADDGESGHVKTNMTQYGGLYEYNGSGVTPAVGANGSYYNTICRNNGVYDWTVGYQDGKGFSAAAGSDPNTNLLCVGCLSIGNKIGYEASAGSIFLNCVSKDDDVDFRGTAQQLNCVTLST